MGSDQHLTAMAEERTLAAHAFLRSAGIRRRGIDSVYVRGCARIVPVPHAELGDVQARAASRDETLVRHEQRFEKWRLMTRNRQTMPLPPQPTKPARLA